MTCREATAVVDPYLDGELDVRETAWLDAHIATCDACAQLVERHRRWSRVVQQAPRFQAPTGLADRIRAAIAQGGADASSESGGAVNSIEGAQVRVLVPASGLGPTGTPSLPQSQTRSVPEHPSPATVAGRRFTLTWPTWLATAAALLLVASITLSLWILRGNSGGVDSDLVVRDVVSSHIRSLMAQHLTDVPSSDRHTVKPWFAGKVPYALTVPDLGANGFTLEGGRLDYVAGRTVAALVYRRHQHVINAFVWPLAPGDRPATETRTREGYEAVSWTAHEQQFWVVSDLNDAELRQFVSLMQRAE
jgi:anti-sigma factor RsiW